jgi:hypothetical protein
MMTFKLKIFMWSLPFYDPREIICIANYFLEGSVFIHPECYSVMVNILDLFNPQGFVACVLYVTLAFMAVDQDSPFYSRLYSNYRYTVIMLVEIQVKSLISVFSLRFTPLCMQPSKHHNKHMKLVFVNKIVTAAKCVVLLHVEWWIILFPDYR